MKFEKESISKEKFGEEPTISNMIYINGRPLEKWIDADTGQSKCCDVCGDEECRTVIVGGKEREVVPSELIVSAGLEASSKISSSKGCCSSSESCCD